MTIRPLTRGNPSSPHILFINPWIHDFAAYDVWAKPYGLLSMAAIAREHGYRVSYIDCLDRFHEKAKPTDPFAKNGRGPYRKTPIAPPPGLEAIPRTYSRYGIDPEWFREELSRLSPPDLILVTSLMTYWWPGVRESISVVREIFPGTPLYLGGIYATLCPEHAERHTGADRIITGGGEKTILDILASVFGIREKAKYAPEDPDTYPYPAFDLDRIINYVPVLSTRGCPFSCAYCASGLLNDRFLMRNPGQVVQEIRYFKEKHGVMDFAFYDDALLVNSRTHAAPLMEQLIREAVNVRFHLPNAIHIREIDASIARLLYLSGFKTIRLGLETTAFDENRGTLDRKVTEQEFHRAVCALLDAGFQKNQVGAYLLYGLPDQTERAVEESIRTVLKSGITPILTPFTPIPHTAIWEKAVATARYDLEKDPVFTNNAILPCWKDPFSWETVLRLKRIVKEGGA